MTRAVAQATTFGEEWGTKIATTAEVAGSVTAVGTVTACAALCTVAEWGTELPCHVPEQARVAATKKSVTSPKFQYPPELGDCTTSA